MTDTLLDPTTYDPCAQCGAPLDDAQRYCVYCGASRHHAADPVARYLAAARRPAPPAAPPAVASAPRADRWTVLALALLPLAAGVGVLVGRNSAGGDELAAALRAQKAPIVQVGAGAGTAGAAAAAAGGAAAATHAASSAFPLAKGFTVELRTLPANAGAPEIAAAKQAARSKGAKDVGVLDPSGLDVSPDPGNRLVLYAGAFHTRAQAAKALAKLERRFPDAKLVAVKRPASAAADSADAPVAKHATAKQKQQGAKIVKQIEATKGKSYVEQQRKLPDTIVVP